MLSGSLVGRLKSLECGKTKGRFVLLSYIAAFGLGRLVGKLHRILYFIVLHCYSSEFVTKLTVRSRGASNDGIGRIIYRRVAKTRYISPNPLVYELQRLWQILCIASSSHPDQPLQFCAL